MKNTLRFIFTITFFAILSWFFYVNRYIIRERILTFTDKITEQFGGKVVPCKDPIVYALGTIDGQFKITNQYFLDALAEAEAVWEKPLGKDLFTYSASTKSNDVLTVNLIYDLRQDATNKLANITSSVKDNRASYNVLKVQFTSLKAEFAKAKSDYDKDLQSFNTKQKTYEDQVKYWNTQGGAPHDEYNKLQAEKVALQNKFGDLEIARREIDGMISEINTLVPILNRLANALNISVDKYNTVGATLGESFEEGVYSSDGNTRKIDIFEYSSREKLVRVLAHEFGHALGIDHVTDPKAIMYSFNKSNNKTLSDADLTALKAICQMK